MTTIPEQPQPDDPNVPRYFYEFTLRNAEDHARLAENSAAQYARLAETNAAEHAKLAADSAAQYAKLAESIAQLEVRIAQIETRLIRWMLSAMGFGFGAIVVIVTLD